MRLGIPLLVGVVILIPVAYYPTILEIDLVFGTGQGFGEFWLSFARRGFSPAGPAVWKVVRFAQRVGLQKTGGPGWLLGQ